MGEFKGGDEAGLLVQAAEVTDKVDDGVLFFEGFIGLGHSISNNPIHLPYLPTFLKQMILAYFRLD